MHLNLNYQITSNAQWASSGADSKITNILHNEFEALAV
jgi:hypothetical protein